MCWDKILKDFALVFKDKAFFVVKKMIKHNRALVYQKYISKIYIIYELNNRKANYVLNESVHAYFKNWILNTQLIQK